MIHKHHLTLLAAILGCSAYSAENPAEKPQTAGDLLRQIEAITPSKALASTPVATPTAAPTANSVLNTEGTLIAPQKPTGGADDKPGEKKGKGPTEITALEATFDQKANVAVFVGSVVVKDPEFNVTCDQLTAYLKHDDKPAAGAKPPAGATPKPATPKADGTAVAPKKGGGLERAVAVRTTDKRVVITQDKLDANGNPTHSIGISDKADYNAITGDIVLTGMPDVTTGLNRCVATDPSTVMTLNRDGHMKAVGPHRTFITDNSTVKGDGK